MKLLVDAVTGPGITFEIGDVRPLPFTLEAWRDATLARGVDPASMRLVAAVDRHTADGWPVGLVVTDVGPRRRLHAFYRFLFHGCVVVVEGEARAFDAVMDRVKDALLAARPDLSTGRPVALAEVWSGFDGGERAEG